MIDISASHLKALNRKRRIICQEDANVPFEALGMDMEQWLKHRFELIDAGSQVDAIFWDVGFAEDSYAVYNDSKLLPLLDHPGINKWRQQNIDWIKVLVEQSHSRGLEAFWSHRISSIDFPQPFSPDKVHSEQCSNYLKQEHPDWVLPCWWPHGLWNMAHPGVHSHKLAYFRELIERYDLDGIQLDFARHTPCLPAGMEWELRHQLTLFVAAVRKLLMEFAEKKGCPLLLAVKIPESVTGCEQEGFDIACWVEEQLVDILVLGGRSTMVDIAEFKRITAGTAIKLCPMLDGHHTADGYYFPALEYFRGVFGNWHEQGADSVGVFNWTCAYGSTYDELGLPENMKSLSQCQAVFEVGSPETLKHITASYAVERRGGYPWAGVSFYRNDDKILPLDIATLPVGKTAVLPVYIYSNVVDKKSDILCELVLWNCAVSDIAEVKINDSRITLLKADPEWKDGQIYCDQQQPTAGAWKSFPLTDNFLLKLTYSVSAEYLCHGKNVIEISLSPECCKCSGLSTIEKAEILIGGD